MQSQTFLLLIAQAECEVCAHPLTGEEPCDYSGNMTFNFLPKHVCAMGESAALGTLDSNREQACTHSYLGKGQ